MTVRTGIFPSAGSAHVWHAQDAGLFAAAGLDVEVVAVRSSDEQMAGWDGGELTVMHTSPDHLLRPRRRDPVALRPEGLGEIAVYTRPGAGDDATPARWGVDGADSAFALVLRAILDAAGIAHEPADLEPVGGTMQRYQALLAGEIHGTALHAPFDRPAEAAGCNRVGGHLDVVPSLTTVVLVAAREELGSTEVRTYVEVVDAARRELLDGGPGAVSAVLVRRGWTEEDSLAAGAQVTGAAGLGQPVEALQPGLAAAAALRSRYFPAWTPPGQLADLVGRL